MEANEGAKDFLRHYPWNGEKIDYYLCISHHSRMRINRRENLAAAAAHDKKLFVPSVGEIKGCSSQPQDMWIWEVCSSSEPGRDARSSTACSTSS